MQLDTRISSQKSMWKKWAILYAMKVGKTKRKRHILTPRKCFQKLLPGREENHIVTDRPLQWLIRIQACGIRQKAIHLVQQPHFTHEANQMLAGSHPNRE